VLQRFGPAYPCLSLVPLALGLFAFEALLAFAVGIVSG